MRSDQHRGDMLAVAPDRARTHAADPDSSIATTHNRDALQVGIRRGTLGFGEDQRTLGGDAQISHSATQFIDSPGFQGCRSEAGADGTISQNERGIDVWGNCHNMHRISMDYCFESPPACMAALENVLFLVDSSRGDRQ